MNALWWIPTIAILGLLVIGAGGAMTELLSPFGGFRMVLLGVLIAITAALVLSAAGALATARGWPWRSRAVRAAAVPMIVSVAILVLRATGGEHPIHDITTDVDDTVHFAREIAELRAPEDRTAVIAQQHALNTDVKPLILDEPAARAFTRALDAASAMPGWEVTASSSNVGRISVIARSRIFRFVDDVTVRVEGTRDGKSQIDVRSRSRVGVSDLGANAARIRAYLERIETAR